MSPGQSSDVATERDLAAGSRAQLTRRRPSDEVLTLLESQNIDPTAVQRLRAELEASFTREQRLRGTLSVGGAEPTTSTGPGESELHAVEEGERRLTRKEQDQQGGVGQLQRNLTERESDWWAEQLGQTEAKEASSKKEAGSGRLRAIN